jgi:hypothetical protein
LRLKLQAKKTSKQCEISGSELAECKLKLDFGSIAALAVRPGRRGRNEQTASAIGVAFLAPWS